MKNNHKISFIIPVFNAEHYIIRCVTNILMIPYNNFEIIVVNDGSTDATIDKLNDILDSRLIIISQENKGVSSARNKGIEKATGDYLTFVDADDIVLPEVYGELLNEIQYEKNFYMFSYCIQNGSTDKIVPLPLKPGLYGSTEGEELSISLYDSPFSHNYHSKYFGGKVYQYIYDKKFLSDNEINFPTQLHFAEDCIFCFKCFRSVTKFEILDFCPYKYVIYEQSASHKYRDDFWNELKKSYNYACDIAGCEIGHKSELYYHYARVVVVRAVANFYHRSEKKKAIEKIEEILNDKDFLFAIDNMKYSNWTLRERITQYFYKNCKKQYIYYLTLFEFYIRYLRKKFH